MDTSVILKTYIAKNLGLCLSGETDSEENWGPVTFIIYVRICAEISMCQATSESLDYHCVLFGRL